MSQRLPVRNELGGTNLAMRTEETLGRLRELLGRALVAALLLLPVSARAQAPSRTDPELPERRTADRTGGDRFSTLLSAARIGSSR